jgi:hypothetical protein
MRDISVFFYNFAEAADVLRVRNIRFIESSAGCMR